jgi:CRISPR/Cas system-associated endonuclease Cas3-HD
MLVNNFKIKQEESMLDYEREVKQLSGDIASLKIRNDQIERENQMLKNRSTLNSSESERYTAELTSLV